jgi:hypothetical protein
MDRSRLSRVAAVGLLIAMQGFGQTATSDLSTLRQRAEAGDVSAQFQLGFLYEHGGGGLERNASEALKWYGKAADQGDATARFSIAYMYFEGSGIRKDYAEAARWYGCPSPDTRTLEACRTISRKDLPQGAGRLLTQMECAVGSNYDYGSAVDLNGDGEPEYQVCCEDAGHGPCPAVVIGKVGGVWKDLTAKEGVAGYTGACGLFVVLESRHGGFGDVCLPNQCSPASTAAGAKCVPSIWNFIGGRYRSVDYTPLRDRRTPVEVRP